MQPSASSPTPSNTRRQGIEHFTVAVNTGGQRRTVAIHIYPSQEAMVQAGQDFNGDDALSTDTQALVQVWSAKQNPQAILRFCHERMLDHIFIHEIIHAAQVIYRWTNPYVDEPASAHFTHYNEEFAHLVSDLYMGLREGIDARYTISKG